MKFFLDTADIEEIKKLPTVTAKSAEEELLEAFPDAKFVPDPSATKAVKAPSMYSAPCAKFTMRSIPKITARPRDSRA